MWRLPKCTRASERRRSPKFTRARLNENVTRRNNGKIYTATRFVLPQGLVAILNVDKGDTVEIYESRDGIRLTF